MTNEYVSISMVYGYQTIVVTHRHRPCSYVDSVANREDHMIEFQMHRIR
jgi:hypothetical protein